MFSTVEGSRHLCIREIKMKITNFTGSVLVFLMSVLLFSGQGLAQQADNASASTTGSTTASNIDNTSKVESLADKLKSLEEEVNPAAWNIRNGCVPLNRIKRIKFMDDQTALMSVRNRDSGKKKIILKLKRECPGIKRNGYIHYASGLKLCAGFDRFSVMGSSGFSCRIASLEPYVNIEEPATERGLD